MSDLHCRSFRLTWLALAAVALGACSSFDAASKRVVTLVSPYRSDVVQGNVVTREQLGLLRVGMSRVQVREILGTALLTSVFHANRWDYVFTLQQQGAQPQLRTITLYFKDDALDRVQADTLPSEAEFVATLKAKRDSDTVPVLEASDDALQKFPVRPKPAPVPLPPAPSTYPPLEP